jgi:hypothetical protein
MVIGSGNEFSGEWTERPDHSEDEEGAEVRSISRSSGVALELSPLPQLEVRNTSPRLIQAVLRRPERELSSSRRRLSSLAGKRSNRNVVDDITQSGGMARTWLKLKFTSCCPWLPLLVIAVQSGWFAILYPDSDINQPDGEFASEVANSEASGLNSVAYERQVSSPCFRLVVRIVRPG